MRNWATLCSEVELPISLQDDCEQGRKKMAYFAGIDASLRSCALCIVDFKGTVLLERELPSEIKRRGEVASDHFSVPMLVPVCGMITGATLLTASLL